MEFDGGRAKKIAEDLSFPRLSGTEGEEKAKEIIINLLRNIGYTPEVEEFVFSLLPVEFFLKFSQVVIGILSASAIFLFNDFRILSFLIALILIFIIIKSTGWSGFIESLYDIKFFTRKSSNIFFKKVLRKDYPDIIFLAHYDSKSQTYPIVLRIILNLIGIFSLIISIMLIIAGFILGWKLPVIVCFISGIFSALPFVLLIFNFTRNKSPGAIDNASGVAIVLELAHTLREWKGGANLYFLLTGAEELGLAGAIRFIQRHEGDFVKEKSFFINFDGIGGAGNLVITTRYGIPPFCTSVKLRSYLRGILRERGLKFRDVYLPIGAGLDSIPIGARGYDAITISCGGIRNVAWFVHSKYDIISNLSVRTMKMTGDVAIKLLEKVLNK